MVGNEKFLILVVCHDVPVNRVQNTRAKIRKIFKSSSILLTARMQYDRTSITKSITLLDVALKFVWVCINESLSNAFKVSFGSSTGLFCCIKAIASEFRLLITNEMKIMGKVILTCQILKLRFFRVKMICLTTDLYQVCQRLCIAFDKGKFICLNKNFRSWTLDIL